MTQQNSNFDVNWRIVDENGKPTPYFEDLWFAMVSTMGGENSNLVFDLQVSQKIAAFSPLLSKLSKDIEDLQAQQQNKIDLTIIQKSIDELNSQIRNRVDLTPLINDIDSIRSHLNNRVDLTPLINDIDSIKSLLNNRVDLSGILNRLNDLEGQI